MILDYVNSDLRDTFNNDSTNDTEEIFSSDARENEFNKSTHHLDSTMVATCEKTSTSHFGITKTILNDDEILNKRSNNILGESINEATNEELIHNTSGKCNIKFI